MTRRLFLKTNQIAAEEEIADLAVFPFGWIKGDGSIDPNPGTIHFLIDEPNRWPFTFEEPDRSTEVRPP